MIDTVNDKFSHTHVKIAEYVGDKYDNVQILAHENWLRLDFNRDGFVTREDLMRGCQDLYEFIKNFDYYQKAQEIKSQLYQDAIKYMRREVYENGETNGEKEDMPRPKVEFNDNDIAQ